LACPPGHPANGGFTDTLEANAILNGLRAYRFVDESRSARNFSRQHGRAQEKIEHLDQAIDQEIAWYVLPAYAENANKKVRY
jgi:hypothetical protein